jgi:hypothetical protein
MDVLHARERADGEKKSLYVNVLSSLTTKNVVSGGGEKITSLCVFVCVCVCAPA